MLNAEIHPRTLPSDREGGWLPRQPLSIATGAGARSVTIASSPKATFPLPFPGPHFQIAILRPLRNAELVMIRIRVDLDDDLLDGRARCLATAPDGFHRDEAGGFQLRQRARYLTVTAASRETVTHKRVESSAMSAAA